MVSFPGMAYLIVCVSALISALLTLFSGFGLGTLLLPAFAVFFPMQVAVAAVAVVHLANNIFKLLLVGRYADLKAALLFGLPGMAAAAGGALLLGRLSGLQALARYGMGGREFQIFPVDLVIGLLMVSFALLEMLPAFSRLAFGRRWLPLGGLISGFFGGLSGHQGAFRAAFLVKSGLSRDAFIGTGVVCAVLVDVVRLGVYSGEFLTEDFSPLRHGEVGLLVLAGTLSAFVGSFIGSRLIRKVTLRTIQRIVAVLLVLMGAAVAGGLLSKG